MSENQKLEEKVDAYQRETNEQFQSIRETLARMMAAISDLQHPPETVKTQLSIGGRSSIDPDLHKEVKEFREEWKSQSLTFLDDCAGDDDSDDDCNCDDSDVSSGSEFGEVDGSKVEINETVVVLKEAIEPEEQNNRKTHIIAPELFDQCPKKEELKVTTIESGKTQTRPAGCIVNVFADVDFDYGDECEGAFDALEELFVDAGCDSDVIEVVFGLDKKSTSVGEENVFNFDPGGGAFELATSVCNSLINMYSMSRMINDAKAVFDDILTVLMVSYTKCSEMNDANKTTGGKNNSAALLALSWYWASAGVGSKDMVVLPYKDNLPGARSSHEITMVGQKAYAFGDEYKPRVPVDSNLYVSDLNDLLWSVVSLTGDIPPPQVGVTMASVGDTIYVFGGRDSTHKELNELYSFNTCTSKRTLLSSGDTGPAHRSYHSITSDDRNVYIFGGCGNNGRLNDLWAYDTVDEKWLKFPVPGENCKGRGGPGLAVAQGKIWVVYGFSGVELDDVHFYDPANEKWVQVETSGEKPSARSVFSTVGIGKLIFIYGGEVDPSDLGHLGAGKFSSELFALDTESLKWKRLEDGSNSSDHPGPRGWCAYAAGQLDNKEGLLVFGGNSDSNDRLGDIFFFTP